MAVERERRYVLIRHVVASFLACFRRKVGPLSCCGILNPTCNTTCNNIRILPFFSLLSTNVLKPNIQHNIIVTPSTPPFLQMNREKAFTMFDLSIAYILAIVLGLVSTVDLVKVCTVDLYSVFDLQLVQGYLQLVLSSPCKLSRAKTCRNLKCILLNPLLEWTLAFETPRSP